MQIKIKDITLVRIEDIKTFPKNPNLHSKEQVELMAEIVEYQGFRTPLIISNFSGYLVSGHLRLQVAKKLKMKEVPVTYQDFDDEDQEYAFVVSDNAIAEQSILDFKLINKKLPDLHLPKLELLGLPKLRFEPLEKPKTDKPIKILECPECEAHFEQGQARIIQ